MKDCSESESESGAGPPRRTRSVAPVGRRLLSVAAAPLSISTSDLSGGGRPARAAPALCTLHRPPRVCRRPDCDALHVCRLYVDGFCPQPDDACRWGHAVGAEGNQAALAAHRLETLPEEELLWLVRTLLRQTAPVTAEEYRRQLAVCPDYATGASCGRVGCFRLHLCPRLAAGGCRAGDGCRWSHRLTDPDNVMVLLRLRCSELSEAQVLARLAQRSDGEDSDSTDPDPGLTDTESEREMHDAESATPRRGRAGAVGGVCSSQEDSKTEVGKRETGPGLVKNGMAERDGQAGHQAGVSEEDGEASRPANPGLKPDPTSVSEQRRYPDPPADKLADKSAKEPSKEEMLRIARGLDLCHYYGFPSKCTDKNCKKLHMCRFGVAGICPYIVFWCSRSHQFTDAHNRNLLARHQLLKLSRADLLKALQAGYLSRNPITNTERRFLIQMCRPYQRGKCKFEYDCTRMHICKSYLYDECPGTSECGLSHNLQSQENAAVARTVGLHPRTAKDIKGILLNPVSAETAWESSAPKRHHTGPSGDSNPAAQKPVSGHQASGGKEKPAVSPRSAVPTDPPYSGAGNSSPAVGCTAITPTAADTNVGLPPQEAEETHTTTVTEGTLPAESARPAGGATGRGGQGLVPEASLTADDSGGVGAPDPAKQTESDGEAGQTQSAVSDRRTAKTEANHQTQPSPTTNGTTGNPSTHKQTAAKPSPKKKPRDKPNSKTAKSPPKTLTKEDMMKIALKLDVCRHYFFPSKCSDKDCNKLHLCRFFIACKCTYAIFKCLRSHYLWSDPHNERVLRDHRLDKLTEQDLFKALRDGYLAKNPVTDLERRFLVQMCRPYQKGFCKREECTRMHICDRYVHGKCDDCPLSHNLSSQHNVSVARGLGLESVPVEEIKQLLVKPITAKRMWDSSAPQQQDTVSSNEDDVELSVGAVGGQAPDDYDSASSQDPCGEIDEADNSHSAGFATANETFSLTAADSQDSDSDESDDDSELPDDGPTLCGIHSSGGPCRSPDCEGFHICGFFLANLCRRSDSGCPLGHSFSEEHNVRMMDVYGLLGGSPEHFQELLDQMTLRARVSFSNEAEEKVAMCIAFNSTAGCISEDCCGRFHVCNRFLAGTCTKKDCERPHCLNDEHNRRVREVLGLAATPGGRPRYAWATDRDIVELIRAKLGVKPGVYSGPEVVGVPDEGEKSDDGHAGSEEEDEEEEEYGAETESGTEEVGDEEEGAVDKETKDATNETKPAAAVPDRPSPTPSPRPSASPGIPPLPPVCGNLILGERCTDASCPAIHVCPHFLAGACRRQHCNIEHRLDSGPNRRVLGSSGRTVSSQNHDSLLKELYKASANVRRAEVYAKLRICITHNHVTGCRQSWCPFVHICQRFASGKCEEKACAKGHSVETRANRQKLRPLKLEAAPAGEVMEMLRAVHGVRSACQ